MSNSNHQQLIHDLIDGQLPDDQVQHVRQLMAADAELAALYQSIKDQQSALRSLPKFSLDDSFADQVVSAAQSQGLLNGNSQTASKPTVVAHSNGWWTPVAVIATLAAMLLVTLFVIPNLNSESSVANLELADSKSKTESDEILDEEFPEDDRKDNSVKLAKDSAVKESVGRDLEKFSGVAEKSQDKAGALTDNLNPTDAFQGHT